MYEKKYISKTQVFLRSFFIQSFWNFERIQNLGFAYCILPFLRVLYPDKEKRKDAILRHLEFFCTHPYMVNILLGLVVTMEEKLSKGEKGITALQISQVKSHLAGPLAALGDSFFWVTRRSFCAIVASSLYFFATKKYSTTSEYLPAFLSKNDPASAYLAVFLFLIMYNMLHIPVRLFGFSIAYKQGMQIVAMIQRFRVLNWGRMLAPVSITWLILMSVAYFIVFNGSVWQKVILAGFLFSLLGFKHKETSTIKIFYFTVLICIVLSYFGAA